MKIRERIQKIFYVCMVAFCILMLFPQNVYAKQSNKPKLDIIVLTDKQEYKKGDSILYTIKLINNSNYIAKNIEINYEIPEIVKLADNRIDKHIDLLCIGEKREYTLSGEIIDDGNPIINTSVKNNDIANTVDNSQLFILCSVALISGILLFATYKSKNKRRIHFVLIFALISGIVTCSLFSTYAVETEYKQQSYLEEIEFSINGKTYIANFRYQADFVSQGNGKIELDQKLDENNIYFCKDEIVKLSGKVCDPDGIDKFMYSTDNLSGEVHEGSIAGSQPWEIDLDLQDGVTLVQLKLLDKLGGTTLLNFKVAKLSDEIQLSKKTYVLSESEILDFEDAYIDCVLFGSDTQEDTTDDGIYVVLDKSKQFTKKIESNQSNPNIGDIIYISPNKRIINGFTGKINNILKPSSPEFNNVYANINGSNHLNDINYSVIKLMSPSFQELIDQDCLMYSENERIKDENILFFNLPDGTNILDNSKKKMLRSATRSNEGLINFLPSITVGNSGFELSYDNTLYDADGNLDTKADQLNFKASIKMDNFSIAKSVFEYKIKDIIPREMGFDFDYDFDYNAELTLGGSIDTKNLVKNLNNRLQKASIATEPQSLNKVGLLGSYQLSGVKMDKEIYLGCIGIQLGSGITTVGTFGDQQRRSVAPIIMVNFVIDLDGKIEATASYVSNYQSYNVESFRVEKKNFSGIFGKLEEAKNYLTGNILGLYDYHFSAINYKSRKDKNNKPILEHSYKFNGEINLGAGAGATVGIMWLGIQPATIGVSAGAEMNGKANINAKYINGKEIVKEIDGKLSLKGGIYAKAALRLMLENSKKDSKQKFGFDWHKKWWLFTPLDKEYSFSNKADIIINVYEDAKNLIKNGSYTLKLEKNNTEIDSCDLSNGKCKFKDIQIGAYKIKVINGNNKEVYDGQINVTKDSKEFNIYLNIDESNKDITELLTGQSYRITCINDKKLNMQTKNGYTAEYYYTNNGGGCVLDDINESGNMSYRPMKKGDFIDIKIKSGDVSVYCLKNSSEAWDGEKDVLSQYFNIRKLDNDPIAKYELNAGSIISLDNQLIENNSTSVRYYFTGTNLTGTQKVIDYYWNKKFGWDITENDYNLSSQANYWTNINEGNKHIYNINSGNAMIYLWYGDADKLVITE